MPATEKKSPEIKQRHGGARPGAGRPSSYDPAIGNALAEYAKNFPDRPSLRHFAEWQGLHRKQLYRWELKESHWINALAVLRYRQDRDAGRAA